MGTYTEVLLSMLTMTSPLVGPAPSGLGVQPKPPREDTLWAERLPGCLLSLSLLFTICPVLSSSSRPSPTPGSGGGDWLAQLAWVRPPTSRQLCSASQAQDGTEVVVKEVLAGDSVHSLLSILDVITVSAWHRARPLWPGWQVFQHQGQCPVGRVGDGGAGPTLHVHVELCLCVQVLAVSEMIAFWTWSKIQGHRASCSDKSPSFQPEAPPWRDPP